MMALLALGKAYNTTLPLIKIIITNFERRQFKVKIQDSLSESQTPFEGLPQRVILSPSLCNIYIMDIPKTKTK